MQELLQTKNIKMLINLLAIFLLFNKINSYSFIPKAGPSTSYGFLEIVPENDSQIVSNSDIAYYNLKCDRTKVNLADNGIVSTTKGVVNEKLFYPNLRRTFSVDFPGADARYDYLCWSVTVSKSGVETSSSKKILKVGGPPSDINFLDFNYDYPNENFIVSYSLPDKNGSTLKYVDVYLRTHEGAYKRLCSKKKPVLSTDNECVVSSYLLMDNPFNLSSEDLISIYVISENAFGKSKIKYSSKVMKVSTPPKTPILPPAEVSYYTSASQIVVNVTPIEGAISYELYYSLNGGAYQMYTPQSTTTFYFNNFNLALGQVYTFYYIAVNEFGDSKPSPTTTVTIASSPDRMLPPVLSYSVENSGSLKVRMLTSNHNGSPITTYHLKIKSIQGELVELPWCDNLEEECHYPTYVLKDSPFYLEEGHFIYAASANSNSKGISEVSSLSEGLKLKGVPKSPANPPYSGSSTNNLQISIKIDELSETDAGDERIISYNVVVQIGENNYISLAGADNQSPYTDIGREILFYDVVIGQTYKFLYRVKNAFGWGAFSEVGYITVPSA